MTVYLVDEPFVEVALAFAAKDDTARIVLLQDAVYSSPSVGAAGRVFVIEDDVARRGLRSRIPATVKVIGYEGLVEMMEGDRVVNFL